MARHTLRDRLRYAFDNTMARGTSALVLWLALITLGLICVHAGILLALGLAPEDAQGEGAEGTFRVLWYGLMRAMDAGTISGDAGDWHWSLLLANLGITVGGIFILSTLISILSSGLQTRLEELRKGRSRVIEEGHTVILGWSPAIPTLLHQFALATESDGKGCVVILAPGDKAEMDDFIAQQVSPARHLRVVVRSGNPADRGDLEIAQIDASKSIVVLHPGDGYDGDIRVMQTLLALFAQRERPKLHVVTELYDPANRDAALLIGGDEIQVILGADVVSRIVVQACRQPGLANVHAEVLDFAGNEIYFTAPGPAAGKTFGEALFAWRNSAVIGLYRDGTARLSPGSDEIVRPTDQILVIAEDDSRVRPEPSPEFDARHIAPPQAVAPEPERTLVLGWHSRAFRIVQGLDEYVGAGSEVCVVTPHVHPDDIQHAIGELRAQHLTVKVADPSRRAVLDTLNLSTWSHILVLPPDLANSEAADAAVLLTIIHLRDIAARSGTHFPIVSEMLNTHNRELAETENANDFVVSNHLVSLMLCQMAESRHLQPVLNELLDPAGAEYYVRPASLYVLPVETPWSTVVEAARRRGEAAVGYRRGADGKVILNPDKAATVRLNEADSVVVVAHE